MKPEWYKEWFDSPYYHILYKDRDEQEAKRFIDQLLSFLKPAANVSMLDLACGKGRYSRHLAAKGFEVVGIDLSPKSIEFARRFETDKLSFFTHDMRQPFRTNYFDYIFNFFTSFGYFNNEKDHLRTIKNVGFGLKENGTFVLDFFNSGKVVSALPKQEAKTVDGIEFEISKSYSSGHIFKEIRFHAAGKDYHFSEKVRAFQLADFQKMFSEAGLTLVEYFGDYHLHPFDEKYSDRLILITQKRPI